MNTKELIKTYAYIFSLAAIYLTKKKNNQQIQLIEQYAFECISPLKNILKPTLKEMITVTRNYQKKCRPLNTLHATQIHSVREMILNQSTSI